jgi:hypothetical protein
MLERQATNAWTTLVCSASKNHISEVVGNIGPPDVAQEPSPLLDKPDIALWIVGENTVPMPGSAG